MVEFQTAQRGREKRKLNHSRNWIETVQKFDSRTPETPAHTNVSASSLLFPRIRWDISGKQREEFRGTIVAPQGSYISFKRRHEHENDDDDDDRGDDGRRRG